MIVEERPNGMKAEFRVHSDMGCIATAQYWILRYIEQSGCARGKEDELELALHEALVNAGVHGNRLDYHKRIYVKCCCEPGVGVSVTIRDEAQRFDVLNVPDPTTAASPV